MSKLKKFLVKKNSYVNILAYWELNIKIAREPVFEKVLQNNYLKLSDLRTKEEHSQVRKRV